MSRKRWGGRIFNKSWKNFFEDYYDRLNLSNTAGKTASQVSDGTLMDEAKDFDYTSTGGIWDIDATVQFNKKPALAPVDYSAFTGSATINEGQNYSDSFSVTGVADGVTVGWSASGTGITSADFVYGYTGTATVTNGLISINYSINADATTEGNETLTFTLDATDSAGNATGSPTITRTITDDSKTRYYGVSTASGYTNPGSMNEGAFTYYYFYIGNPDWIVNGGGPDNMYWSINPLTPDFSTVSGQCEHVTLVTNYPNSGDSSDIYRVGLTTSADFNTEGTENFTLSFRESSISGTVRATTTVTVNDTSKSVLYGVYSTSDSTPDEGTTPYVNFYVTNSTPTMYWSIDPGTSDFGTESGSVSWYTSVSNYPSTGNTAYLYRVNLSVTADNTTEGAETHFVRFRTGSTSGTIQATQTLTVQDTSTSAPSTNTDYSSTFTQIASRHIDSNIYMGTSSDYTGPYDVHVTEPVLWTGTTGRVYLATKITSSTTFYSDLPIACVQHFSSSGTLKNSWNFSSSSGGTGSAWTTTTSGVTQSDPGMNTTPAIASNYTYSSITAGSAVNRFNWATSTGSSNTGAAGGISTTFNTNPITTSVSSIANILQVGSSYYMYVEASGSTHNQAHWARSPLVTINNGDYFKIVYAVTGLSTVPQNPNDCLWFAIY